MGTDDFGSRAGGEILPGTLEMLILKALASKRLNGAEMAAWIHRVGEAALSVKEGALYPALHRLEKRGAIECEEGPSRNNRRAKFYRLSASGTKELEEQRARWSRLVNAIGKIMQEP